MDTPTLIVTITSQILSFSSAIIVFVLGVNQNTRNRKNEVYKERIEHLYKPFYHKCLTGIYHLRPVSDMSFEIANLFLDLFSQNIHYMGTASQKLFTEFYLAYLDKYISEEDITIEQSALNKENFSYSFIRISKSLLSEYTNLCKKLKLEPPIKLFDWFFSQIWMIMLLLYT